MSSLFLELSKQQKLLQMMEERGFTLCQQNGQRTYGGPPPNWGSRPVPSRDCEVFIGRIPRMCFEDELIPLFLSVGELYEFRLMLDFSGTNRGYGYAHYATQEGAMNAIKLLNRYEIRPGYHIGVLKSKNNCRLLFGNIKPGLSHEEFSDFIRSATGYVLNVFTFSNFEQLRLSNSSISVEVEEAFLERLPRHNPNCQFAIVEYENHKAAAVARRVLIPKYGHILAIDWAVPPREKKRHSQVDAINSAVARSAELNGNCHKSSLIPLTYFTKSRPVPTLTCLPPLLVFCPYAAKAFSNVLKYFKFLITATLDKSAQKGDIPLNIFIEIDRKIVDNINNLENCGQAIQLIFNYLSWYNETKTNSIDLEAQQVLEEVKLYSDSMVHFLLNRMTSPKPIGNTVEDYYCTVLPLQLNILYRMSLVLPAKERESVSGRISSSLKWFWEIINKAKSGDAEIKEFLVEVMRTDDGSSLSEDILCMGYANRLNSMFSRPSILNSSGGGAYSCSAGKNTLNQPRPITDSCHQVYLDDVTDGSSADSVVKGSLYPFTPVTVRDKTTWQQNAPEVFPNLINVATFENQFGSSTEKYAVDENWEPIENDGFKKQRMEARSVPVLLRQPSQTEFVHYMPRAFYNVAKYFKYIIRCSLERAAVRAVIPFHTYKEIESKIVEHIVDLESCSQAVEMILKYFSCEKMVMSNLSKVLQDVKLYSNSFINYIRNRESFGSTNNWDLEDYYCRVLPHQLSFLFHLVLLLTGEEKIRLSSRVTEALQWLNELIHKNKSGDIEALDFFEQISKIALSKCSSNKDDVKSVLREAYDEYNVIISTRDISSASM